MEPFLPPLGATEPVPPAKRTVRPGGEHRYST